MFGAGAGLATAGILAPGAALPAGMTPAPESGAGEEAAVGCVFAAGLADAAGEVSGAEDPFFNSRLSELSAMLR